jgi:hypothetical protein
MKVYGLIRDCGDGSSCIDWFSDRDKMITAMDEDEEAYWGNEGSPAVILTFDDNTDLKKIGIRLDD